MQESVVAFQDVAVEPSSVADDGAGGIPFYKQILVDSGATPVDVLTRPYPVATFPWVQGNTAGTLLQTVNFPDALFAIPYISRIIGNFKHFRAGVKITIRMNGNKFLYGALLASWDPATCLDAASSDDTSLYSSAGFPHALVLVNDPVVSEIMIPYVHPDPLLDIATYQSGHIGSLDVTVAGVLWSVNATTPPSIGVTVYAQFVDPVLQTPTTSTVVGSPAPITRVSLGH